MYLYYDRNKVLKEIINDEAIVQGLNRNKIFIYYELQGDEPLTFNSGTFKKSDNSKVDILQSQVITISDLTSESAFIPYNPERDLKYFKYGKGYPFTVITVNNSVYTEDGTVVGTVTVTVNNYEMETLSAFTFMVEKTNGIETAEPIDISMYEYLTQLFANKSVSSSATLPASASDYNNDDLVFVLNNKIAYRVTGSPKDFNKWIDFNELEKIDILQTEINQKQDKLTPGAGVTITPTGIISATTTLSLLYYPSLSDLPSVGELNTIYMVSSQPIEPNNNYDEYIWDTVNSRYEKIGTISTQVDLSNYYNKTQTEELLSNKQDKITSENKLSSDLVDDINQSNKFVSANEKNFLNKEYEKTINLWKYSNTITTTSGGYVFYGYGVPLKAGTYTFSFVFSGETSSTELILRDSNDNVITNVYHTLEVSVNSITFSISSDASSIAYYSNSAGTYSNIMINEGSTALPYQSYSGEIVHASDITPKLLWENGNPTSDSGFPTQVITLNEAITKKYVIIGYRATYVGNKATQYLKIKYAAGFEGQIFSAVNGNTYSREFTFHSSDAGKITFFNGYNSSSMSNGVIIPVEIYETDVL